MSSESLNLSISGDQKDLETEVELISLLTETLPHYTLRTDYSVRFFGYRHCDFNQAEQIKEKVTELTNEQIHQTLEYFILCGLRVSKMTETYEDCAALTLLVQEQRTHLDLAANIGLNLVEKNTQLEQRVTSLEEQLEASKDTIKQISHQLSLKDDLLRMFHNEIDDADDNYDSNTEPSDNGFQLDKINVRQLETKLSKLEEENMKLRDQQNTIACTTDLLESKESQLVNDCVSHILESTKTIDRLSVELNKKTNDYLNQHEEISRLLTTKIDLENKTHNLLSENDHLITQLRDHQTKEFTLTKEISDMRDRYDECINLLNEKQDEIRRLKKSLKKETKKNIHYYNSSSPEPDFGRSLASELEESTKRDTDEMDNFRTIRIMEQARCLNSACTYVDDETSSGFTEDFTTSMTVSEAELPSSYQSSGNFLLRRRIQDDCERRRLLRQIDDDKKNVPHSVSGTITPHSQPSLHDSPYITEAIYHHQNSCNGFSSLNSSIISRNESSNSLHGLYRYPEKLQLVKPIEGSQTLRAWQNLATPSITKALFEDQPTDVCFRGQQLSASSLESSPNSGTSQVRTPCMARYFDDLNTEGPSPPILSATNPESHSNTYSYSNSRMQNPVKHVNRPITQSVSSDNAIGIISSLNLSTTTADIGLSSLSATPVNEMKRDSSLFSSLSRPFVPSSSSWLDRFTVGSIMTSILGYSKPLSSALNILSSPAIISSSTFSTSTTTTTTTTTTTARDCTSPETSLIGRLTNLPPLASKRKVPLQHHAQSGLNLLTSLEPLTTPKTAVYRSCHTDSIDDTDNDPLGQVD